MVIKLDKRKFFRVYHRPLPLPKMFVTRMLMRILLAVANLLVFLTFYYHVDHDCDYEYYD